MTSRIVFALFFLAGVALSQPPPNNPDIRVLPFGFHQTDPRIAVNRANPDNLMIVMSGLVSGVANDPWLFSTNGGLAWFGSLENPPGIIDQYGGTVCFFGPDGRAYYVALGSPGGIYVVSTSDFGTTWSPRTNADPMNSTGNDAPHATADPSGTHPNNVYAAWTDFNVAGSPVQFTRSTDRGATWSNRITLAIGSNRGQGVSIATGPNGEINVAWAHYTTGTAEVGIGFSRSTDGGMTFSPPAVAFPINGIRVSNGGIAALNGARANSFPQMDVDRSSGSRGGWIYIAYPDRSLGQSNVYIRRSTDGGTTWSDTVRVSSPPVSPEKQQWLPSIAVDQSNGEITLTYASMDSAGANFMVNTYAAHSTDGGDTWERWVISDTRHLWRVFSTPSGGFTHPSSRSSTTALGGRAWSAWSDSRTDTLQVWLERIDYTRTSASETRIARPTDFELFQNYPNPFNPTTNFGFRIANFGFVTLKVYDVLGRDVATLVNEVKEPGRYEVTWDAADQVSGTYFYTLTAGGFRQTRKLVILR